MDWLAAPIDATRIHEVGVALSWHGRLMVLAWAGLIPAGILLARFFKVTPKQDWPNRLDNKAWWHGHLTLQYAGVGITVFAIVLAWFAPRHADQSGIHFWFGWSVAALALAQIAGGLMRGTKGGPTAPAPDGSLRGDHFDMTRRRVWFERIHKFVGYVALLVACAAILTGLWQANAPRWFFLTVLAWWGVLAAIFTAMQRRGMALDTYQAIWGPSPSLPGNRIKPIGIGVVRRNDGANASG